MNTDVVDPAYHVGLVGARNRLCDALHDCCSLINDTLAKLG